MKAEKNFQTSLDLFVDLGLALFAVEKLQQTFEDYLVLKFKFVRITKMPGTFI